MALPPGSRLGRAFECLGSATLPRISEESEFGISGRWKHEFSRAVKEGKPVDEAVLLVPAEFREACSSLDSDALASLAELEAEVGFIYDVRTKKTRRSDDPKSAGLNETFNRIDFAGIVDGVACVVDIKTGYKDVEPAAKNWQLRGAAISLATEHGLTHGRGAILYLREGQRARWDIAEYDQLQLDADGLELQDLDGRIERVKRKGEAPSLRKGDWCGNCGSKLYCPAFTALIRMFVKDDVAAVATLKEQLTPELAAEARANASLLRNALKNLDNALYSFARETGGIKLPSGRVWGPHVVARDEIDGVLAYEVLKETYGQDTAIAASEFKVSKERIYESMRAVQKAELDAGAKKRPLTELEREALAKLRAAGAITKVDKEVFEEHNPPSLES